MAQELSLREAYGKTLVELGKENPDAAEVELALKELQ